MQVEIDSNSNGLVSFIVIAYNASCTIMSCINSIMSQTVVKQIILVDNNSDDGTSNVVSDLPLTILFEKKRCRGTARNRGLAAAEGSYVAFVDADVELASDWTTVALALLNEHPDVVAVGGPGFSPGESWVAKALDGIHYGNRAGGKQRYVNSLAAMDVMYRADQLRGKWFKDFWAAEDPEFNFQLAEEGHRFLFSPHLAVTHHHVSSLKHLLCRSYKYGMWFLAPYLLHPSMVTIDVALRVIYIPILAALGVSSAFSLLAMYLFVIWLIVPILLYSIVSHHLSRSTTITERVQFVFVHSFKQYAQMMGIWVGILRGTGRSVCRRNSGVHT